MPQAQTTVPQPRDADSPREGNWTGWRAFRIAERHPESEIITSFVLRPVDGGAIADHVAGQHLTFAFDIPGRGEVIRNYTISTAPNGDHYRITVKREPNGTSSKWLHDEAVIGTQIRVAPPSGAFVLPDPPKRPVVLLSGGVGLTPMIAMLEAIVADYPGTQTHYVHGTLDGSTHAMRDHVRALGEGRPEIHATTFYERPRAQDEAGRDYDRAGYIDLDWLKANTPFDEADFFICGPMPFLRKFISEILAAGVPADRLHYEVFGSSEELMDLLPDQPAGETRSPAPTPGGGPVRTGAEIGEAEVAKALVASPADAVVASDREGLIVLWNAGAERIFGFTKEEAVGQSLDIIIPEQLRARHWEGYHQTVSTGVSRYGAGDLLAVPGLHKDGHRISLEFTIVLMAGDDGQVTGMVSSLRDVTRRFEETRALKKKIAELEGTAA